MSLFKTLKQNQYIENMRVGARTQLSLLNTLNSLQQEYEHIFNDKNKEIDMLKQKIKQLEAEYLKLKNR